MDTPVIRTLAVAVALAGSMACHRTPQVNNSQHAPAIRRVVSSSPAWIERDKPGSTLWKAERDFYQSRDSLPAWFDGDKVVPLTKTATLKDENVAFFQIGLFRETSDVPETILLDHVIEATTLAEVAPTQSPNDR